MLNLFPIKLMHKIFTIFFIVSNILYNAYSQELLCNLTVNTDQIRTSETQIFNQLQQDLQEFINNKRWSEDIFKPEERIECDIVFNIKTMRGQNNFVADVMIQTSRPVFGTDYSSPLFTFFDEDLPFQYQMGQPIYFTKNVFTNNLTSAIAFYAYIILGFDYDSFSKRGGDPYFDKANEILIISQNAGDAGWTADSKNPRSRFNLITQILNPQYSKLREGYYTYHRLALDDMEKDQVAARKKILEVIKSTEPLFRINPNPPYLGVFYAAKVNEITGMFSKASAAEKQELLKVLEIVDPINMKRYDKIKGR